MAKWSQKLVTVEDFQDYLQIWLQNNSSLSFIFLGRIDQVCHRQWDRGASHLPAGDGASHRLPGRKLPSSAALWGMFGWTGSHRSRQARLFDKWNSRKTLYLCGKKPCSCVLFSIRDLLKVLGGREPLISRPFENLDLLSHIKQFRVMLPSDYWKIQLLLCSSKTHILFVIKAGVEDPNFAYGLLMELTRAFLAYADNVRAQDSAAYAIQVRYIVRSCFYFTDYFL